MSLMTVMVRLDLGDYKYIGKNNPVVVTGKVCLNGFAYQCNVSY